MIFWKFSLVSALVTSSVEPHFPTFKETDPNETKGSLESRISNCLSRFADLVIDVMLFMGRRHGDGVKQRHISTRIIQMEALSNRIR